MSGETKTRTRPFLVGVAVGVLVTAAFLGRYRIVGASFASYQAAYRLDSWTGSVLGVRDGLWFRLLPERAELDNAMTLEDLEHAQELVRRIESLRENYPPVESAESPKP